MVPRLARCVAVVVLAAMAHGGCRPAARPPQALGDEEFWALSRDLSEPPGTFSHSENLVSNEIRNGHVIRLLRPSGGVYIGVGPEQNFTYIARLRPHIAFVADIRRENRSLHLMYKALFELAADRVEFVSRLFSRPVPAGLDNAATATDIFAAYSRVRPSRDLYDSTVRAIRTRLLETRRLPIEAEDVLWIEYALDAFFRDGPGIHYSRGRPDDPPGPSYRTLMTVPDLSGGTASYLGTAERYDVVRGLQLRNLIVPVIGDFAGDGALRRIGEYARGRGLVVRAFYASNVEVYLNRQQAAAFCANLAALPHDGGTRFIVSRGMRTLGEKLEGC